MKKLLLLAFLAAPCFGAVAVDVVSSSADTSSGTTITWSHTVGSGSNRALIVAYQYMDTAGTGGQPATGITYNGVALTKIRDDNANINISGQIHAGNNSLWYLVAPATGAHSIVITTTADIASYSAHAAGSAISLTGVDQSTPIDTHFGTNGTGTTSTTALTTTIANSLIISSSTSSNTSEYPVLTGGTSDTNTYLTQFLGSVSHKATTTAGAYSAVWTTTASYRYWSSAVAIAPASSATFTRSPTSIVAGTTGNVITLTGTGTAWTGSPFSLSGGTGASITAQNVTSATAATVTLTAGSATGTLTITDTISGATQTVTVTSAASLSSISPTSAAVSSTGNVITLTGTGTSWTAGTPGTPTFTIAGACTITAQTVASATSATITVTAPGSAGSCTITDPSTGTTINLTITGSGYSGTVVGSPTFGAAKFSNGTTVTTDANYITLPAGVVNVAGDMTIEAWVSSNLTGDIRVFYGVSGWLGILANGNFGMAGFGFAGIIDSGISISDTNMHHVAAVFTATAAKLYVDGVLGSTTSGTYGNAGNVSSVLGRFNVSTGYQWPGRIDEFAVWSVAKYSGGSFMVPSAPYVGTEANLRALYHLQSDATDSGGSLSLSASPVSIPVSTTGNVVTLTGAGTSWTPGTPGTPTFTLTGGTGASITAQSVASANSATVTITSGSALGTLTITDPSNGATATVSVTTTISLTATPTTSYTGRTGQSIALTGTNTTWTSGTPGVPTFTLSGGTGASITSQSVASGTAATIVITTGSATGVLTITDPGTGRTATITLSAPTISRSPTSVIQSTTGNVITLTGVGTLWTAGTPGSPTFTLSGGTGASITAQSVASNTSATVTITAGSALTTLTITDPSTSLTTTVTVNSSTNTTIPVTSANVFFSPLNWYSDGAGALAANNVHGSSTYVRTNNPGAYVKTIFSGTSAKLAVDTSFLSGSLLPIVRWSIDNGAYQSYQIASSAVTEIPLTAGLASGSHTLFVYLQDTDYSQDRWTGPMESLKVTGIVLDGGASVLAPSGAVAIQTKNIAFYGDSITEGSDNIGGANLVVATDPQQTYVTGVADAFGAEWANMGFAAQAWTAGSPDTLVNTWSNYSSGKSRLVAGKLSPIPDYVMVNMGTNDGSTNLTSVIQTWIGSVRAAVNSTTPIFIIVPFKGTHSSEITSAISGSGDGYSYKIDLGALVTYGVPATGPATRDSLDNIHPSAAFHGRLGAMIAKKMQEALGGTGGSIGASSISFN